MGNIRVQYKRNKKDKTVGLRTYRVMIDDHTVQQGPNSVETTHVQTCEILGKTDTQCLHSINHKAQGNSSQCLEALKC